MPANKRAFLFVRYEKSMEQVRKTFPDLCAQGRIFRHKKCCQFAIDRLKTAARQIDILDLSFEDRRLSVSAQRFTPEFKEDAVMPVTERGYSVAEIPACLSVFNVVCINESSLCLQTSRDCAKHIGCYLELVVVQGIAQGIYTRMVCPRMPLPKHRR